MTIPTTLPQRTEPATPANRLWSELRTNRRAQLGAAVIVILVAGYGLSLLRSASDQSEARYRRAEQTLARIAATEADHDWPQRAKESAAVLKQLDQQLWSGESEGVAQADLQAWIGSLGREIGLSMLDIHIESGKLKDFPPELRQITATVTAQPSETAVVALLERLEQPPHMTVVSRVRVRQQPSPLLELVLVGYARIAPSGSGGEK